MLARHHRAAARPLDGRAACPRWSGSAHSAPRRAGRSPPGPRAAPRPACRPSARRARSRPWARTAPWRRTPSPRTPARSHRTRTWHRTGKRTCEARQGQRRFVGREPSRLGGRIRVGVGVRVGWGGVDRVGWGGVGWGWGGRAHDGCASQCCMQGSVSYDSGSHAAHPSHASPHSSPHGGCQRGALPTAWVTRAQPARHASPRTPMHAALLACARPSSREALDSSSSSQKASCRSVY